MIVQCAGLNSWAIRVVTLVLHFAGGLVLVRVSVLLIEINDLLSATSSSEGHTKSDASASASPQSSDGETVRRRQEPFVLGCCLSALLFLVHPIHVEVVAWPSAQPYAQAVLFANVSLLVYVEALHLDLQRSRANSPFERTGPRKSDWLVAGLYLCSVLSKSMTVLLPAVFVLLDLLVMLRLYDISPLQLKPRDLLTYVSTKAPVLVVMLAFIGVTIWSNVQGSVDVFVLSLPERILKVLVVPAWTMGHILWPAKLRVHYQTHEDSWSLANPECLVCIAALVLCVLAALWLWKMHQAPQLLLGVAYFLAMALPTSGLVQHGVVSQGCDRYAYFPSAVLVPFGGYWLEK
ncbi:hypothetical protein Gpo141_00014689, partial [Globisporangium polare]